jgi:HEPN domain-containing protein
MPAFRRSSTLVHDDGFDALLTKGDLEQLAELRLMDAVLLHENARYSSAYYLSGYAVELALKACIARQIVQNMIPDRGFVNAIYTHDLENLLTIARLRETFRLDRAADRRLAANWFRASQWKESSRYEIWDATSSADMLSAVGATDHGVFQWVKRHW